jgi:hypothetical protein
MMDSSLNEFGISHRRLDKRDRFELEKVFSQLTTSDYTKLSGAIAEETFRALADQPFYVLDKLLASAYACESHSPPLFYGHVECGDEISVIANDNSWVMVFYDDCCRRGLSELYRRLDR